MAFVFINNHGVVFRSLIPSETCEKMLNCEEDVWPHIKNIVPLECNGEKLIGPGKMELLEYSMSSKNKKTYEPESYDKNGNCSACTIFIYCNDMPDNPTLFYSAPKKGIYFTNPSAEYYTVAAKAGTVVLFTHSVPYKESTILNGIKYVIKVPIMYRSTPPTSYTEKRVSFGNIEVYKIENREKRKKMELLELEENSRKI